ncbi:MAG: 7-cyano-7-deazaguanine synthase QueC [Phycisphaerales bacterium]|nr:7-cyano-7-deazaguanine synthase QueC [Phycisphaerales bacterium]
MMTTHRSAVVLVSGGLDSATVLALARESGYELHALSFDYGQRHRHELDCAVRVAEAMGAVHRIITVDPAPFRGSALTDGGEVPMDRSEESMSESIPDTYVPARNMIMLAHAAGYAEGIGSRDLFIGVNAVDYSGYPDCRPAFIEAFEDLVNLATRSGVEGDSFRVHAPLLHLDKATIIRRGLALQVDYGLTSTCYAPGPGGAPCGRCDACQLRAKGFAEAGAVDPLVSAGA